MTKVGKPTRLIAYDTDLNIKRREQGQTPRLNVVRARTMLYAAVIAMVGGIMLYTLATRGAEAISVIHERNPVFIRLSDGAIRNVYTARISNKQLESREFVLSISGLAGSFIEVVGAKKRDDRKMIVEIGPDQTREFRVLVTSYNDAQPSSTQMGFHIVDVATGERADTSDFFRGP
jgi:polyferredoxin